jgi:hypothetical protein
MKKENKNTKEKKESHTTCPICELFDLGSKVFGKESEFFEHITNARIEFLKAIRSVLDKRIKSLEKDKEKEKKHKYSKIAVQE